MKPLVIYKYSTSKIYILKLDIGNFQKRKIIYSHSIHVKKIQSDIESVCKTSQFPLVQLGIELKPSLSTGDSHKGFVN